MNKYSEAIKDISVGLFLIVFNFNIGTIDLLPNWVGFYLIYKAINEIGKIENSALLMKNVAFFIFVFNTLEWILNFFGISIEIMPLYLFISILTLYLYYHLFTSISLICESRNSSYTKTILNLRNVLTVTYTLSSISIYFINEDWSVLLFLVMITYIISMIVMIVCLSKISKESKNYYF